MLDEGWADAGRDSMQCTPPSASEVDEAVDWAEQSPYPDPAEAAATTSTRAQ